MKKAFLLFLAALLCLGLYACGEVGSEPTQNNSDMPLPDQTEPHIHAYTEWVVSVEATCTTPGEKVRSCTICSVKETRKVAKLAHAYGEWTVTTVATCTALGEEIRTCECGNQEARKIPLVKHNYVETGSVEPTPANPVGSITYGCNLCGDSYTEQVTSYGSEGLIYKVIEQEGGGGICRIVAMGACTDTELVIPKYIDGYKVVEIGKEAFRECNTITSVVLPDSVFFIGENAFNGCSNLKSVTLQAGLLGIGRGAFHWCLQLSDIIIPETVQTIGDSAFRGVRFKELVIPDSVTVIEDGAFDACDMVSVTLSKNIVVLSDYVFNFCLNLSSIEIPEGVTKIGKQAFYHCALTTVTIPATVTCIDEHAFWECSKLTQIHFQGTMAQWENIQKDPSWDSSTGYYTIYCTDGEIEKNID